MNTALVIIFLHVVEYATGLLATCHTIFLHEHSLRYYFFARSTVRKWRLAKCPAWEYHYVVLVTIPQNCPSKKRSKIAGAHHR